MCAGDRRCIQKISQCIVKKFFNRNLLLFILLVSAFLRLFFLDLYPPHLRNDEAALGYNSYSILKTARDEHGEVLPLIFRSFGDWKIGLYIYLTIPFIFILGLNELAIRLPSAISGIISVYLLYKITYQLFLEKRLALISSAVLALSPIFIAFSRGAWEVNVSLIFTLAMIYAFLLSLEKKNKYFILSAIFFGLSLLSSHGAKLSSVIIFGLLFVLFFKQIKKLSIITVGISLIIGLLLVSPIILSFFQGKVTRIVSVSIFSYPRSNDYINTVLKLSGEEVWSTSYYLYYHEWIWLIRSIISHWFGVYSFSTLFIKGDLNPQHSAPNSGAFLLFDGFLLILGLIQIVKFGIKKESLFLVLSIFLLPLPSVLTNERVNFERILPFFIPVALTISLGINYLWKILDKKKYIFCILVFVYLLNYIYFLDQYLVHNPKKNAAWQYGYKNVVENVSLMQKKYEKIVVEKSFEQPYIFFLFYQNYPPFKYQEISKEVFMPSREGKEMGSVSKIDNIYFEEIDWSFKKPIKGTLYIMSTDKLKEQIRFYPQIKLIKEIHDLGNFPLFKIIEII